MACALSYRIHKSLFLFHSKSKSCIVDDNMSCKQMIHLLFIVLSEFRHQTIDLPPHYLDYHVQGYTTCKTVFLSQQVTLYWISFDPEHE